MLHITDIHLDPDYSVGSNAECGEPLCCRDDDGPPGKSVCLSVCLSAIFGLENN